MWLLVVTVDSIFLVASPATGSTPLTLPVATSCSMDLVSLSWKDAVLVLLLAARLIVFKTDTASVPGTDVVSVPLVIVAVTSVITSFGAKVMAETDPASVPRIDAAIAEGLAFSFACRFHGACECLWQIGFFFWWRGTIS